MLIDLDMVDDARELLKGKDLWLKTPLWYDNNGNRVMGKNSWKYPSRMCSQATWHSR